MPDVQTKVYLVESVAVLTRDHMPTLIVRGRPDGDPHAGPQDVHIFDQDHHFSDGTVIPGVPLSVDGHPVDRAVLLRWAPENRGVRLEVDADPARYGMVVAARFTAGGASSGS
jgi:hypothetical protein